MIISVLNFLHHSRTVLGTDFVGSSHLSSGSLYSSSKVSVINYQKGIPDLTLIYGSPQNSFIIKPDKLCRSAFGLKNNDLVFSLFQQRCRDI